MGSLTRCNYCDLQDLKARYKPEELIRLNQRGWISYYRLGAEPIPGQDDPIEHEGKPIQFLASFAEITKWCACD